MSVSVRGLGRIPVQAPAGRVHTSAYSRVAAFLAFPHLRVSTATHRTLQLNKTKNSFLNVFFFYRVFPKCLPLTLAYPVLRMREKGELYHFLLSVQQGTWKA